MLSDAKFRRTARCGYYSKLMAEKEKAMQPYPVVEVVGADLTAKRFNSEGLDIPLLVSEDASKGLGLQLPPRGSTLQDVARAVGPFTPVKLMEVGTQTQLEGRMLGEYADYLAGYTPGAHKVLNMITLEVSTTTMASQIQAPTAVRAVDWIDTAWPLERRARGDYPAVQRYCLSGMAGSFTDFHVDFGGTSVWYHVLSGHKRFYLVPPSCENLAAYAHWSTSAAGEDVFFGDYVQAAHEAAVLKARAEGDTARVSSPQVYQLDLLPGQTLLIPGAWIHAVFTPADSLVFGGNFLHSAAILRQLQVYQVEQRTRVGKQYRFPYFKELHWYVLCRMLPVLHRAIARLHQEKKQQQQQHSDLLSVEWDVLLGDEDDEDLAAMARSLLTSPLVLRQWPYLVRACADWVEEPSSAAGRADAARLAPITSAAVAEYASGEGCGELHAAVAVAVAVAAAATGKAGGSEGIVSSWWALLQTVAEMQAAAGMGPSLDSSRQHMQQVRDASRDQLDFLNPAFVAGGLLGGGLVSWPEPALLQASALAASNAGLAVKVKVKVEKRGWVCCEACGKWRSLPAAVDLAALPDSWLCAMNTYDDTRNTCDAEEEVEAGAETEGGGAVSVAAPTERQWVQCTLCEKWRTVSDHVDAAALSEDWCCEDNLWDASHATCEAPEETEPSPEAAAAAAAAAAPAPTLVIKRRTADSPQAEPTPTPSRLVLSLARKSKSPSETAAAPAPVKDEDGDGDGGEDGSAPKKRKMIRLTLTPQSKKKKPTKAPADNLYAVQYDSMVHLSPPEPGDSTNPAGKVLGRTRGKKLSASYLRMNADADVSEDGGYDDGEDAFDEDAAGGYEVMPLGDVDAGLKARMTAAAERQGIAAEALVPGTILTASGRIMAAPSREKAARMRRQAHFDDSGDRDGEWGAEDEKKSRSGKHTVTADDFAMSDSDDGDSDVSDADEEEEDDESYVSDDGLDVLYVEGKGQKSSSSSSGRKPAARSAAKAERDSDEEQGGREKAAAGGGGGTSAAWQIKKFVDTDRVSGAGSSSSSSSSSGGGGGGGGGKSGMPSLASLVGSSGAAPRISHSYAAHAASGASSSARGPTAAPPATGQGRAFVSKTLQQAATASGSSSSKAPAQKKPPSREALLKKLGMRR